MKINMLVCESLNNNSNNLSDYPMHKMILDVHKSIPAVISRIDQDLKNINLDNITNSSYLPIITKLLYLTGGRLGNIKSIRNHNTYGIYNLLKSHISFDKQNNLLISYIGKKQILNNYEIKYNNDNRLLLNIIKELLNININNKYLFSNNYKNNLKSNSPISPLQIYMYLNSINFPGTPHRFRKYKANVLFVNYMDKTNNNYKESVNLVSNKLCNTPSVCISSYICPILSKYFFDINNNSNIPKSLQNALINIKNQNPDEDI